ncbi:unnamed protein product [Amaranthus hypochondriacus]
MPNGSLDKYICSSETHTLAWETRLQIAIGIGHGLEYLHQGSRTRILHFDIKPHNILLDEKFCPKIWDFGLAKLQQQTKSSMTMSGTRGTPGYIALEVYCRGLGGAFHKSEVYRMLVLNLVGSRNNDIGAASRNEMTSSELYFPDWIYKQLELKHDLITHDEVQGIRQDAESKLQVFKQPLQIGHQSAEQWKCSKERTRHYRFLRCHFCLLLLGLIKIVYLSIFIHQYNNSCLAATKMA